MKQTLGIVRYNFFGFFRNPKVIFTLFLEFVLSFLLTGRIMVVMDNYNTPVQAIEPFLWTFGDGTAVLLSSMLLLLLFSDLPKMTPVTPYQLIRTTKKKWLLGQFVYITFVTILYTCFMLLFTSVLCMKDSYPGNLWSDTAAMLGYSDLGKNLQVPSTVRVMESISPDFKLCNSGGESLQRKNKRHDSWSVLQYLWISSGSQCTGSCFT